MKVLLLEDEYYEVARSVFVSHGAEVVVARDLHEFENGINNSYDVACLDIFFPEETGKGLRDKGREAFRRISSVIAGSELPEFADYLIQNREILRDETPLEEESATKYISELVGLIEHLGPSIVEQVTQTMQAYATWVREGHMQLYKRDLIDRLPIALYKCPEYRHELSKEERKESRPESYDIIACRLLRRKVEEGPENAQPLGIIAAEMAMENGVPFVLASDLGHHSESAQPVCVYQRHQRWPEIIDPVTDDGKNDPAYWENVFEQLIARAKK